MKTRQARAKILVVICCVNSHDVTVKESSLNELQIKIWRVMRYLAVFFTKEFRYVSKNLLVLLSRQPTEEQRKIPFIYYQLNQSVSSLGVIS